MLVFRSVLEPLTATLGFLLSVLATLGATVLVFQEGLFGLVEGQPLVSFMPIIVIGIVFDLAMDYQVFLVTRMRGPSSTERRHGRRSSTASGTARAWSRGRDGHGLGVRRLHAAEQPADPVDRVRPAAAVFFDAFVVRMVLIPSVMYLLGDKAWWLPAWLDRLLPNVDVEGEPLTRLHAPVDASEIDEDLVPVG